MLKLTNTDDMYMLYIIVVCVCVCVFEHVMIKHTYTNKTSVAQLLYQ